MLLWAFVIALFASVPVVTVAIFAEDYATNANVRTLAQFVLITDALAVAIVASLTFWMIFRHVPPAMNRWRMCATTVALAYVLGSTYELVAQELIGHPLPTLEQLAPGVTAFLPVITWVIAIILVTWGVLAALDARRAMQRDARQRRPTPTPPPSDP